MEVVIGIEIGVGLVVRRRRWWAKYRSKMLYNTKDFN